MKHEDLHAAEHESFLLVSRSLELDVMPESMSKDQLIALIAQRVNTLLETEKDLLMSYLYRLDISMKKINNVLKVKDVIPPHQSLAVLIFDRQLERVMTKRKIKVKPIDGWDSF